jgi:predicted O-linked N-acetylglucosamine transferase (SPINDLY family)
VKLAGLRLAPVQAASWGHPETSGLPSIDYYLSADLLEPPDAQRYYSETLVNLPNLGCCYQALPVQAAEPDFAGLGINRELPLLVCPGTPFKYTPEHDRVFVEIARRLQECQFVFFVHPVAEFTGKLRHRLEKAFRRAGLRLDDFAVFIPWLERPVFYGLLRQADVFLDTIGFSGFNTAMQAVECGLPLVTRDGRFMRGRLASGILRRMDLEELITDNDDSYVSLAVRLVQDTDYRNQIRQRIDESQQPLFDDTAPIRQLEEFFITATTANAAKT